MTSKWEHHIPYYTIPYYLIYFKLSVTNFQSRVLDGWCSFQIGKFYVCGEYLWKQNAHEKSESIRFSKLQL